MKRHRIIIILIILLILTSGCSDEKRSTFEISIGSKSTSEFSRPYSQDEQTVVVYICGAVKSPGVYTLKDSSRIVDLIEAAGGTSGNADLSRINLAQKLSDGQQVIVPERGSEDAVLQPSGSGKINLNFADKEELMTLPGIGEAKAEAILAYREEIGWFQSPEEIMNISGIKEKMFARIADRIEV